MTKTKENNRLNFMFRVTKKGRTIQRYQSRSKRRFYNRTGSINWQDGGIKVYLRVNYGKYLSNMGRIESFWNDGEYSNQRDFILALNAFTEDC